MSEAAVDTGGRYWAFISYSHKDAAFGRRLHRRLETYALPRRIVGQPVAHGTAPRRLAPIFRDRDEFPAAKDLSAEVRAALKVSRSLIVVCSPTAAQSPWVAREIELFHALHPDRPILAAIREGDPLDSFPEALRHAGPGGAHVEPLAADFRRGHDGWDLGLLKLVAGVLGVGLDELIRRDAQRRARRVTAVTAGALALVLVMAVLTLFAISARQEAERQRAEAERQGAEAEGLVEFMLTDLRKTLKKVGRLDVLTAVNQRALLHYTDQDLKKLPPDSLERRAKLLLAMGEDDEERGEFARALAEFHEASRTTSTLLAADQSRPDRIFAQAQSEYWVALIEWRKDNFDAAQAGFQRYADLAARLLAADPANPDWRLEASYAESNLGTLALRSQGNPSAAHDHFARALRHKLEVARARPRDTDLQRVIANTYGWLADSERLSGKPDSAVSDRFRERRILMTLAAADPMDVQNQYDMLGNDLGLSRLDMDRQNWALAGQRLDDTIKRAQVLLRHDPDNKKLAKQVRALQLFRVESLLNSGATTPETLTEMENVIGDCDAADEVQSDAEVGSFCRLLEVRLLVRRHERARAQAMWKTLAADRNRWSALPYSPRWGIDFRREYAVTNAGF